MPDVPKIEVGPPSPYSADRGFFGSHPFSRANELLEKQGGDPIDWRLPEPPGRLCPFPEVPRMSPPSGSPRLPSSVFPITV